MKPIITRVKGKCADQEKTVPVSDKAEVTVKNIETRKSLALCITLGSLSTQYVVSSTLARVLDPLEIELIFDYIDFQIIRDLLRPNDEW